MKTTAEIDKAIISIKSSGAKLDAMIQATALDVLAHHGQHHDTTLVNRLYAALPAGARKSAMASWLMAYGDIKANTDSKTRKEVPFVYAKEKAVNIEGATADAWFNHKPDVDPNRVFDLQVAMKALLRKVTHAANTAHVTPEALAGLKAVALAVGIPESDVPTAPKAKAPAKAAA